MFLSFVEMLSGKEEMGWSDINNEICALDHNSTSAVGDSPISALFSSADSQ